MPPRCVIYIVTRWILKIKWCLQKEIWAASDLLAPMLEKSVKVDGNWRTNQGWFNPSSENDALTPGCINLSPAWFQQGHEVGSDEMAISVVKLTNPIESIGSGGICIIEGTILREDPESHCEASSHCNSSTQGYAS